MPVPSLQAAWFRHRSARQLSTVHKNTTFSLEVYLWSLHASIVTPLHEDSRQLPLKEGLLGQAQK